jgi:hypothetical protein
MPRMHCLSFCSQLDKRDVKNSPQPVKESMQVWFHLVHRILEFLN